MGTPISQFTVGGLLRIGDLLAGLRGTAPNQSDYKFSVTGIGDTLGANLITWTPGAGPNVNYIDFQSNVTGSNPIISALGTDTNINLLITPKGIGHVLFGGTSGIGVPYGTTAQQPAGFAGGFRYNTDDDFLYYWDIGAAAWVQVIDGAAPIDATYITNTDETADLPNSQPLSVQPSGFLSSVTATGIVTNRTLTTADATNITVTNGTGAAGNPAFNLATTAVSAGSYSYASFIVDAYGRLTSAASGAVPITAVNAAAPITSTGGATPTIGLDTPLDVIYGGTLGATFTKNMPILAGTTDTGAFQSVDPTGALPGFVLEFVDANTPPVWAIASGPSELITQNSHGFSVGEALYLNSTVYTLAMADNTVTAEVVGVCSAVIDANTFALTTVGKITGLSGLTPGEVGWLSDATPGLVTETIVTTIGNITKPIWIADTTTSAYIYQERGKIIPNPAYSGFAFTSNAANITPASSTGYFNNGSGTITYSLSAASAQGDYTIIMGGTNTTPWVLQANTGQVIHVGSATTTSGGTVTATNQFDAIGVVCVASNVFNAYIITGNLTTA